MEGTRLVFAVVAVLSITLLSCTPDDKGQYNESEKTRVEIRLTDAPSPYDEVNIDIRSVSFYITGDGNSGWKEFPMLKPGIYNLLDYQNGADTLLGANNIVPGKISQVRIELGSNNSVIQEGFNYYLFAPTGKENAITFGVDADLYAGMTYRLWIDFDAARSLIAHGMGFSLNPVIRTYTDHSGGTIEGFILPSEAKTKVWAVLEKDSMMTYPGLDGYYRFSGLTPSASWKLVFDASNRTYYRDVILRNVPVIKGESTVIPPITHPL